MGTSPKIGQRLRETLGTMPPPFRAAMLAVLTAPDDADRAEAIGNLHATAAVPAMAERLIDTEEDPALRAVLVGMLREPGR